MKSFGSMRRNFNIPSPKSQSPKKEPPPKARRPMLNPDASPHANRMARPPRFPEIFEEDEAGSDALEDDRAQSPTPITRRKKPRSTTSSLPHILARPSSPTPPGLHAPIIATIQVDINESLLKQSKKRISRRQSGLISVGSGNLSSGFWFWLAQGPRVLPSSASTQPCVRLAVAARCRDCRGRRRVCGHPRPAAN
jgi:hypothetical protein